MSGESWPSYDLSGCGKKNGRAMEGSRVMSVHVCVEWEQHAAVCLGLGLPATGAEHAPALAENSASP